MAASNNGRDETLERYYERRQAFYQEIDALRAEANAIWDQYRADGTLPIAQIARLEGIKHKRQELFNAYQEDEERFIDLVLKRRSSRA